MTADAGTFDPDLVGVSGAIQRVRHLVVRLARSDAGVLVTGESGVGKEVVARNLHGMSVRSDAAIVTVNCAALAPGILESELFGHGRGAFTGAVRSHAGFFEQADGGTLFLDEVGEIPLQLQAKLLRTLQEREVRRMGEGGLRKVDVRVVAATNADLPDMVANGRFRVDLFYRLNVVEVFVPPLRERTEDVLPLFRHFFLSRTGREPGLTDDARSVLLRYPWPGNVRELVNEVDRLIALYGTPESVTPDMLSARLVDEVGQTRLDVQVLYEAPLSRAVGYLEASILRRTLIQTDWNKSRTARRLGLSRQGLLKKIRRYGITRLPAPSIDETGG